MASEWSRAVGVVGEAEGESDGQSGGLGTEAAGAQADLHRPEGRNADAPGDPEPAPPPSLCSRAIPRFPNLVHLPGPLERDWETVHLGEGEGEWARRTNKDAG